ncbi:acyl-ACP--UDP-N-acetylglucosamine O-acyltransferase [Paenibacillus sp. ACRRY]|uniref:acyl-ACP--UDP-N-acetylglucosamine O-acyltransferase n=1 Tax=Paenibacillus sp. ACRRY TaxID=2918208 RepID=UPI001EF5CE91|nr:acyl-ACP--UDP-N-acetylglucosamine O-acyltransferase [Paenibacillus sp. ACRRY]MCG7384474.1 acyl-ACP--UDP-N-acetylglucosamine O-acyltransferase [Paenibacillus sp. ACRRY]
MIHQSAIIHPTAVIEDNVEVGPFSIIEENSKIGSGCRIGSHVIIGPNTIMGGNNYISHGAIIGSDPQDKSYQGEESYLIIGENNIVREYVTICKGTSKGDCFTRVGNNNFIMNYAHIAHDVLMGDHNVIVNNVQIGGHVNIEDYITFGCGSGVHQSCNIGRFAMIGAGSKVSQDIVPYSLVDGSRSYIHGINIIGLRRNGFTNEEISTIKKINTILFRQKRTLDQSIEAINNLPPSEFKEHTLNFLNKTTRGIVRMKR